MYSIRIISNGKSCQIGVKKEGKKLDHKRERKARENDLQTSGICYNKKNIKTPSPPCIYKKKKIKSFYI